MALSTADDTTIRAAIIEYVITNFIGPFTAETMPLDESLVELEVIDSYGVVELVAYLEETWSIAIADEEITREKMGSVNKMVALVQEKLAVDTPAVAVG